MNVSNITEQSSWGEEEEGDIDQDDLWAASLFFIIVSVIYVCAVLICGVGRGGIPGRVLGVVQDQRDKRTWVLIPSKRDYDASELLAGKEEEEDLFLVEEAESSSIY
jgi:hypothetical protein